MRRPLALLLILAWLPSARAADVEEEKRTFAVFVDGKPSGTCAMTIRRNEEGVVTWQGAVDVEVKSLITFRYTHRGVEQSKDGELLQFASESNDNGKKASLQIRAAAEGYSIKAGGKETLLKGTPWMSGYWCLPPAKKREQVTVVDGDTGKVQSGKLEKVGVEKLKLKMGEVTCNRYRLSGDAKAELWYDGDDRLIRQETIEDGHKTIMELVEYSKK